MNSGAHAGAKPRNRMIMKTATLLAAMSIAAVVQAPSASAYPAYGELWIYNGTKVQVRCLEVGEGKGLGAFYKHWSKVPVAKRYKSDIRNTAPRWGCFVQ